MIKEFGSFSPNQFDWFEDLDKESTTIKFKKTEYYFAFFSGKSDYWAHFSPGNERLTEATGYLKWNESTINFNNWLFFLERELTTPNHWAKFKTQISGINFRFNYDNEKFTYNEYTDLKNKID